MCPVCDVFDINNNNYNTIITIIIIIMFMLSLCVHKKVVKLFPKSLQNILDTAKRRIDRDKRRSRVSFGHISHKSVCVCVCVCV